MATEIAGMTSTDVRCPYCKAKPGKKCRRRGSGNVAEVNHDARFYLLAGFREGYKAAVIDASGAVLELAAEKTEVKSA